MQGVNSEMSWRDSGSGYRTTWHDYSCNSQVSLAGEQAEEAGITAYIGDIRIIQDKDNGSWKKPGG